MEDMLLNIVDELRAGPVHAQAPDGSAYVLSDAETFSRLIDRLGKGRPDAQDYSKHRLLSYYQEVKRSDVSRWKSWNISPKLERRLLRILQTKPRRTSSGVATITVITKPWRCASDCLYCPNDVRMPKSYLSDEPACQRAERNFFDPYLQVQSRLQALTQMGHLTDKVELIVLGGSWCDYSQDYQLWFTHELYRALNDTVEGGISVNQTEINKLRQRYLDAGFSDSKDDIIQRTAAVQQCVDNGELSYNQAIRELYEDCEMWQKVSRVSASAEWSMDALRQQQAINESSQHRMVGFTVETRPDLVTADTLVLLRQLGVTRLQIGIQSLDSQVLRLNRRHTSSEHIHNAFALARTFGFKIHGHFMQNLYGSSREADAAEYAHFMTNPAYIPDEIKLYPCSLVAGTGLVAHYEDGSWQPYPEEELVKLLATNTINTPSHVRISRMIRDISSHDIMAGSKRTNLRQLVEKSVIDSGETIREIRHREVSSHEIIHDDLKLDIVTYESSVSQEHFLQWVTGDERIAGFLRLSLPKPNRAYYLPIDESQLPMSLDTAIIREVHVYGKVAAINKVEEDNNQHSASNVQHFGLGRKLIEKACEIAEDEGYTKMSVISSVGTRRYYRKLGFLDDELYQVRNLLQGGK
ncbi:MAG: tRNA uridine(34) 5-carboxymethylaminomethyl modification radical SAM/GNAT enzyme Elp3 [Coriobacteriia bacterium]|nr:tRNA uridine(34) 5-carboxymethylaminomethyl modification radical SAM/GNAT enzyme Elp3 [Coriobacteriia bacterium]